MIVRNILLILVTVVLAACASTPSGEPSDSPFDITQYFDGRINGDGIIERGNRVVSRFEMIVDASSEGEQLILDETFRFDNGSDFRRVWQLNREAPGVWVGGAENVQGTTRIEVIKGVVYMHYVASFPYNGGMISLRFNQQLIPMDGDVVLNHSKLSKFGVPVGTVTVLFRSEDLET